MLEPDYAPARTQLGYSLLRLKSFLEAEQAFRDAIALEPGCSDFHSKLGIVLYKLGQYQESEEQCRLAINQDPGNFEAIYFLALGFKARGDVDEAIRELERAIELFPHFMEAAASLANIRRELARSGAGTWREYQAIRRPGMRMCVWRMLHPRAPDP
jgi:tetratricopeptide (TPR) repeat protein